MVGLNNLLKTTSRKALKILKNYNFSYNEQWKYTNIDNYKNFSFTENIINDLDNNKNFNDNEIIIINNILQNKNNVYPFIHITSINDAIKKNLFGCKDIFNQIIPLDKNHFILYNTAYFNNGNYLYFEKNHTIENPICINNSIKQKNLTSFFNNRLLFHFGENFSGKIILKEKNNHEVLTNIVCEVYLEENTNVNFIIESEKHKTTQILNFGSTINKNAILKIHPIDISGKLIKNNYFINLKGKNSQCYYNGLNLLNHSNHIDNYIEVNHNNKHTISHTNQKNILDGKSKGIFYSKATINKYSANSEAHQKNNNLILSNKSIVHSNPQLMIYNNDVQCSHGSSTGEVDYDALFYLRSRGISIQKAKKMLVHAFIDEIIDTIDDENIKNNIQDKIYTWIKDVN